MSSPHNIKLDNYEEELEMFFGLGKDKIQSVIEAFNKNGGNVSFLKFHKLTGLSIGTDTMGVRDTLAIIGHMYLRHRKDFEQELATSQMNKSVIEGLKHFFEKLENKGLRGLDMLHSVKMIDVERPLLVGLGQRTSLNEIKDESGELIGFVPIMRIRFRFLDEEGNAKYQYIQMPVDTFQTIIESFSEMRKEALASAKNFREKIGSAVILSGDD